MGPVGRAPEGVVGDDALLYILWRQVAEGGEGLVRIPVNHHLRGSAEKDVQTRRLLLA